jgi:hypothetical protein
VTLRENKNQNAIGVAQERSGICREKFAAVSHAIVLFSLNVQ